MRNDTPLTAITACILLGLAMPAVTLADLPADQKIAYLLRDTPDDPNSPVVFGFALTLKASDADGNSVGWEIVEIEFAEFDENGEPDETWIEDDPNVPTADGLWWIDHVDGTDPEPSEFAEPPLLEGTAVTENFGVDDLDYTLEGVPYEPPQGGAPYTNTAALDHEFTQVGVSQPIQASEEEPVEIPPGSGGFPVE